MAYHLDFETFSEADLNKQGGYRYANDTTTEVLVMSIARNDEAPLTWGVLDLFEENEAAVAMLAEAVTNGDPIYAHNAYFEAAICRYLLAKTFGVNPPKLRQWRCTAAMARRAAIPSALADTAAFLGLAQQKDTAGKALLRLFAKKRKPTKRDPRTRIAPADEPEKFRDLMGYCRTDVLTERAVHGKLAAFEMTGPVLDSFQFDLRMNERGVPVDVDALRRVDVLIDEYTDRLTTEFVELAGFRPTQRAKVLEWLRDRGYPFGDLQAASVDQLSDNGPDGWETRYVEWEREKAGQTWQEANPGQPLPAKFTTPKLQPVTMTPEGFRGLQLRANLSFAAVKKVPTMLAAACDDGRVRGTLLWSGAERTHRWAGKIIQPQNFRRPTFKGTEHAFQLLREGADIDTVEMLFGPFLEVVASCIRHFIKAPSAGLVQADFSSVEARGAPWLCGGHSKLQMFRDGEPIYETMASKIFGVSVDQVIREAKAGDGEKRFIGKQAELGCTYNMGRPKFRGTCENWGYKPSPAMVEAFKPRFRRQLARMTADAESDQPWDEFEVRFPRFKWAMLRNSRKHGRTFTVMAYRKSGARRKVADPHNPTTEEWADLTYDDLADRAVTAWRSDNPEIVAAWKSLDIAAKKAIQNPGRIFHGTDKLSFGVTTKPGFRALVMRLPSGHTLIYPKPRLIWKGGPDVEKDPNDWFNIGIQFWGKLPMKSTWGWCDTYGGKLLENATQAICGDFMANGACNAWVAGYDIFMLVHDEAIAERHEGHTSEGLCKLLCDLPDWADGMPLEADGNLIPFYKKT